MSAGADAVGGAPGARWAAALDRHGGRGPAGRAARAGMGQRGCTRAWACRSRRSRRSCARASGLRSRPAGSLRWRARARRLGALSQAPARHAPDLPRAPPASHPPPARDGAARGGALPPPAVRRLLRRTLALRERRERGELEGRGLRIALDRAHTDRALVGRVTQTPNRRLLRHLRTERPALFIWCAAPTSRPRTG